MTAIYFSAPTKGFLRLLIMSFLVVDAGCCRWAQVQIPVTVIDMHSHMFNARDLPLAGILNERGAPDGVAKALATLINWWTPEEDELGHENEELDVLWT